MAPLVLGVAQFEVRLLVGGVLGEMRDGAVVWGAIFAGVGYGYWDLFCLMSVSDLESYSGL